MNQSTTEPARSIEPEAMETPSWKAFSASGVGLEMGLYVILGFVAGDWLDSRLGTEPFLMIAMVLFGVALGVIAMVRASRSAWGVGPSSSSSSSSATATPRSEKPVARQGSF